jgi:phosphoadenosine phosphosulfate reductase
MSATPSTAHDNERHSKMLAEVATRLENASPAEILADALERYPERLVMACSFGMQSSVVLDVLSKLGAIDRVDAFYLDTGVLFPQTHQTRLRMQERYGARVVRVASDMTWKKQQVEFGGHLYERGLDGINECCRIRKVEPQRKYLADKAAWITGMRRTHNKERASVPVVLWDAANGLAKYNPLALWDDDRVWAYIEENDVPYNALYDQGYPSIGCKTPQCTRKVKEGDDPRSGRWADVEKTECGINLDGNAIKSLGSSKL